MVGLDCRQEGGKAGACSALGWRVLWCLAATLRSHRSEDGTVVIVIGRPAGVLLEHVVGMRTDSRDRLR